MRVVGHLCLLFCILGSLTLTACGNERANTDSFTIGILNLRPSLQSMVDAFKAGMADLGYVEGETIHYQYNGLDGIPAGPEAAAKAFVAAKVDLLFALGTPSALAAQSAVSGTQVPVIFAPLNDPVQFGMVKSLIRPSGNMTGVRTGGYVPKQLEWLLNLAPNTKQIFVPHDPTDDISAQGLAMLQATAERFHVEVLVHETHSVAEIEQALAAITPEVDAILILPTTLALDHITLFTKAAIAHKLPLAVPTFLYVEAGALVSYGSSYPSIGEQVSRLADKILHGVPPADLPVETAEFYLGINLQTAEAIGLSIPNGMIQQALFVVR